MTHAYYTTLPEKATGTSIIWGSGMSHRARPLLTIYTCSPGLVHQEI